MDFSLNDEQKAMQEMAKNFAEKKIAPTMEEDEKEHTSSVGDSTALAGIYELTEANSPVSE